MVIFSSTSKTKTLRLRLIYDINISYIRILKGIEVIFIVFLLALISITTTSNASEQDQSIRAIQQQDYSKQFAEFSQFLIIPNTLTPSQTYMVYGQVVNFLTGEGVANTTISFRIFPPIIGLSTPFNTTTTDPKGNFKIKFNAPDQPSFYYLAAYLTGNKNYYPTDSESTPLVVFK